MKNRKFIGFLRAGAKQALLDKAREAYSQGYNSLFLVDSGSYHDPVVWLYASKVRTGRKVSNPDKWLEPIFNRIEHRSWLYQARVDETRSV